MSDDFEVEVQIRTPFPVPIDRLAKIRKLVDDAKFAHGQARGSEAFMTQEGYDLVISYKFTVEEEVGFDDD